MYRAAARELACQESEGVMDAAGSQESGVSVPPVTASPINMRWINRSDMDEVQAIEKESFDFPWCEDEFLMCLRQRNVIGMVAELDHKLVGFMIYELHRRALRILNFAVDPEFRRRGIGRQMVRRLADKLSTERRTEIVLEVGETNLPAQLFFGRLGFTATKVLRGHYSHPFLDAYAMRLELPYSSDELVDFTNSYEVSKVR